jgi:hypothetical protein
MKKVLSMAAAGAALVLAAGLATSASATTYIGTYTITANTSDSAGLQISTEHDFTLNFGLNGVASLSPVDLFDIWTNSTSLDSNDGTHKDISVLFNFSSPGAQNGTVTGDTFGVNGSWNYGQVTWDGPIAINFGATTLHIALDGATFNADEDTEGYWSGGHFHSGCDNCLNDGQYYDADVVAHFSQTLNAGGVPEPASWALMISGFGMTGAMLRRRRGAAVAVAA